MAMAKYASHLKNSSRRKGKGMGFRLKSNMSFILMFIWLFGETFPLWALDRYVVEPGTVADGNGGVYTDWSIAATQIQWAISASTNAGDTIWVSNGTYVLTNQIVVVSNIVLRSTNGPEVTIVNGNFTLNAPDATTNNRCLFLSNGSAFVSGFTFSNGACTNLGGGGVLMYKGILSNCTICNNTEFHPTNAGGLYYGGGGIMANGNSTVATCRIIGNVLTNPAVYSIAGAGGGVYCRLDDNFFTDCLISNNVIYGGGGTVQGAGCFFDSAGIIQYSLICNNSNPAGYAGGVYFDNANRVMIGCTVVANWASSFAGCYMQRGLITNSVISNNFGRGIYMIPNTVYSIAIVKNSIIANNMREGIYIDSTVGTNIVTDCLVEGNMSNGVTMYQSNTNQNLLNCVVRNNRAGGVRCRLGTVRNCLIAGNTNAGPWGGLFIQSGGDRASISGCTITSNQSAGAGAGIRFENSAASVISVSSCIIYSNGVAGTNDLYDANAPVNYNRLQYSCLGTNPGFTGAVIIVADPQFNNFAGGDYRLSGNSPCVNAGSNEPWMTNAYDLDKNQRIRYGTVDMGAYERINEGVIYSIH